MELLSDPKLVREPQFAAPPGMGFYPDDPIELTKMIASMFKDAKKEQSLGEIVALVSPHAGYVYSGRTAACAYKQLEGRSFDTVVVISPSHQAFFPGAAVYHGGAYRTPLGEIKVDLTFVRQISNVNPIVQLATDGHTTTGRRAEHALEVQLPFLQVVLGDFAVVPIVMGDQEFATCRALGDVLGQFAMPGKTLIVASTDLAHGHDLPTTNTMGKVAADRLTEFDHNAFFNGLKDEEFEACGGGPVVATMIAAQKMGADTANVIGESNSADVTGPDTDYIVGYMSAVLHKTGAGGAEDKVYEIDIESITGHEATIEFSPDERALLLAAARRAIENAVKGTHHDLTAPGTGILTEKRGVFVTLHRNHKLRGCIGYIRPYKPLFEAVVDMAESAATRDDRFYPVEPKEADELDIEITVLSPLVAITNPDDILVGRHGILITQGPRSGVLLPQVATEHEWDREQFLEATCQKAGLAPGAWHDPATKIEIFTAEIF